MKTVDFSKILFDSLQLCGLDRDEITDATFSQIRDFASNRLTMAWEHDVWPDLIRYEQITVQTDGNVSYCVKPNGAGEVIGLWTALPISNTRASIIPFAIQNTGTEERLVTDKIVSGTLYIEYRIEPIVLNGYKWDNTVTYEAGAQAYFDSGSVTGTYQPIVGKPHSANFYVSLLQNTNHIPSQNPAAWKKLEIPYIFGQYVARAVFADYLRSEGQFDSAVNAEQEARHFLDIEIDKIVRQQGQVQRFNFIQSY